MNASFEEKSVWVQLVATAIGLGVYFFLASKLIAIGVNELPPYAILFTVTTIFLVVMMVVGHVIAAITGKPEGRDERDRLIEWKAEARSSWILAVGVFGAITAMLFKVSNVWIANGLLLSLFVSTMVGFALRLISYRRGV